MADPDKKIIPLPDVQGLSNFEAASAAVIEYLHSHIDVGMWMATRVADGQQILLSGKAEAYGLEPGSALPWADTICERMTAKKGPNIALNVAEVPEYAESPLLKFAQIGTYVGVPIHTGNDELFGTLCALSPDVQTNNIDAQLPLLKLLAQMLGAIATQEMDALQHSHHIKALQTAALTDALTDIANRHGWNQHLKHVQTSIAQLGSPVSIFIIDVDDMKQVNDTMGHTAGDELLKNAATVLTEHVRDGDLVARIGGDEFAIAALECGIDEMQQLQQRLTEALVAEDINASVGAACHKHQQQLTDTISAADAAMYRMKRSRQEARSGQLAAAG